MFHKCPISCHTQQPHMCHFSSCYLHFPTLIPTMEVLLVENEAQEAFVWACPCYFAALERVHCNCLFKDNNKGRLSKEFSTQSEALRQTPQPHHSVVKEWRTWSRGRQPGWFIVPLHSSHLLSEPCCSFNTEQVCPTLWAD